MTQGKQRGSIYARENKKKKKKKKKEKCVKPFNYLFLYCLEFGLHIWATNSNLNSMPWGVQYPSQVPNVFHLFRLYIWCYIHLPKNEREKHSQVQTIGKIWSDNCSSLFGMQFFFFLFWTIVSQNMWTTIGKQDQGKFKKFKQVGWTKLWNAKNSI